MHKPKTVEEKNDITLIYDNCLFIQIEKFLKNALTLSRTIWIRKSLSLMWLYPLIKPEILSPRFLKNYKSIKIWK